MFEASQPFRIRGERCGQNFDRNITIDLRMASKVDLANATRAKL